MRIAKAHRTIGPSSEQVGVGQLAAVPEVSAEGSGPATVPQESVGVGRFGAMPEVLAGPGGSATVLKVPREGDGSVAMALSAREVSLSAWEQGAGSKWPRPEEAEQGPRGLSPKHILHPTAPM